METLVIAQHRNQYYTRSKSRASNRFGSPPSKGFKGFNCRSFESSVGILPSPRYHEPKSPRIHSEPPKHSRRSNPIDISPKPTIKGTNFNREIEEFAYSELWAGPAYSNSPPPSSLPIPKFSCRPKRSISLDLPLPSSRIELPIVAKSTPSSPIRDSNSSAAENIKRILNMDIAEG